MDPDPDPGGPKTRGSRFGSRSATLVLGFENIAGLGGWLNDRRGLAAAVGCAAGQPPPPSPAPHQAGDRRQNHRPGQFTINFLEVFRNKSRLSNLWTTKILRCITSVTYIIYLSRHRVGVIIFNILDSIWNFSVIARKIKPWLEPILDQSRTNLNRFSLSFMSLNINKKNHLSLLSC